MKSNRAPKVSPYLTKQQESVLKLCRDYVAKHGRFPSRSWIQTQMGWAKEQSVYEALLGLVGAGHMKMKIKGTKRIFDLVEGGVWDAQLKQSSAAEA